MSSNKFSVGRIFAVTALASMLTMGVPLALIAQTRVSAPRNKYDVQDDVKAGRQAAQQVEQQLPLVRDQYVQSYIERIGNRLVDAIPNEFQQPAFRYSFKVVDARDINAFALPAGFTYVNRGLIDAARNEGELAGVMAHEISHVALRHATAQATETQKYQIGSVLGQIAGAVIGGGLGQVIGAGSQIGFGAGALKYSRGYETQSDLLGAQIMARAGYDPRDLANMFRTIAQQGGNGAPEFLSSHPDPGNRYQRINQEAALLRVSPNSGTQNTADFRNVQARLRGQPRARTMGEISRSGNRNPNNGDSRYPNGGNSRYPDDRDSRYPDERDSRYPSSSRGAGRAELPSSRLRTYNGGYFRLSVPENFREGGGEQSVVFVPEGGAYQTQGETGYTHGVMVGVERTNARNLRAASNEYISQLLQGNQYLRQQGTYQRGTLGGRAGLATNLVGRSPVTGATEFVTVYTTQLQSGELFYFVTIAPQNDYRTFSGAFDRMRSSLQLGA